MHDFAIKLDQMEKVTQGRTDPKWHPEFAIRMAATRKAAIAMDEADSAAIQVYTDG
jgi:hypothetical protein